MKKLASLLLALVMIMSCFSAMAEETPATYTITINNATANHTYEAYQIFVGDLSSAEENDIDLTTTAVLANVKWGSSVVKYDGAEVTANTDATAVAGGLTSETLDDFIEKLTLGTPVKTVSTQTNETYVIDGLAAGYYLVKDKDDTVTGNDAYTEFIIEVVENSTVTPKSSVPQVEKQVKDTNDTTGENSDWQDSADHDINDVVPFKLTATLANNVSAYENYKIIFHDTLSVGLTYNEDAKVFFNGTEVTNYFQITCVEGKLTISCNNVKEFNAGNNSVITVEYTATLNENAVIGAAGNPNKVYLEYSNNPNWDAANNPGSDGEDNDNDGETDEPDEDEQPTGETPEDVAIVFTFEVDVNKVTAANEALTGATFALYKQLATDPAVEEIWQKIGEDIVGTDKSLFTWKGLDDGNYKLVEVVAPIGYNLLPEPIYFTIEATHDETSDDPKLLTLVVKDKDGNVISEDVEGGTASFSASIETGILTTNVVNLAGAQLPETGGMGTTILYVGGGILILAAIVLLIVKRRANAE